MSADRQVSTDALATLGMILGAGVGRDAIHLAVEPVIAAHPLAPGTDVGFIGDEVGMCDKPLGIVDPFLKAHVKKGERFWLIIYPRQITSLRHVWTHPEFEHREASPACSVAERWLRDYAATIPVHYADLLDRAMDYVETGEYWCEGGRFEGYFIPEEFWDHYAAVTGRPVGGRGNFFTCSC